MAGLGVPGKRKVLITGASGRIGRALVPAFEEDYELVLIDREEFPGDVCAKIICADAADISLMRSLCDGVDTVVPLAISGNMHDGWETLQLANLTGIWAALQAAAEAGCRRVIIPSTILLAIDPERPYCSAKLWAEQIGEAYARRNNLSVIALRIGAVVAVNEPVLFPDSEKLSRILTHTDLVRLFSAAIEAPDDIRYGVFWGISANNPGLVDISETRRMLGYSPKDDAFRLARRAALKPRGIARITKRYIKKWIAR